MVKAARKPHSPNGLVAFSKILPDQANANRGTKRGAALIKKSLKEYGAGRSILLDKNNRMIAGNKTLAQAAAGKSGIKGVRIIETDGSELFGGSGTTTIAAEKMGRLCYSIEIEPKYCDVICQRWEAAVGQKAKKVAGA
jgi:hypothetical protein